MKHFQWLLVSLSLAFLVLTILVKTNPSLAWDLTITRALQDIHNPFFDSLMKYITDLGFQPGVTILLFLASIGFYIFHQKKEIFFVILSTLGAIEISVIFKQLVGRPRPDSTIVNQVGQYLNHDSFPSGHVLFFVGFFGYLLYLTHIKMKPGFWKNVVILKLGLLIILIGVSRIYLGAHWFSDVLGSYLIGTVWLIIVVHLHHKLERKF